ncbi:MAG: GTPase Era [Deltaproteobacteria bacterium]|nr:GTPase Era [Deltaproteobacteria bacterium]
MPFKSGFISIIGRPNVGKSTLLNTMLGEKISIVSEKPQTTRNTIRGVKNFEGGQIVFLDTPGVHEGGGLLNRFMVKEALGSLRDVDGVLFMADATRAAPDEDDLAIIRELKRLRCPVVLAINKVDRVDKRSLLPLIGEYSRLFPFKDIFPVSALKGAGVGEVEKALEALLPEGPKYFPEDIVTDTPVRFLAGEIVREKVFQFTHEEVPYSVAVVVEKFEEKKDIISISAVINVERDSQKGIIIGKKGAMLKRIGTAARLDIEKLLASRVYLELFVRVQKEWTRSPASLKGFGY